MSDSRDALATIPEAGEEEIQHGGYDEDVEFEEAPPDPNYYFDGKTFISLRLAKVIVMRHIYNYTELATKYSVNKAGQREDTLMQYDGGVWRPASDIEREAHRLLDEKTKSSRINETIKTIKRVVPEVPVEEWDNLPDHLLNCKNGLVDLSHSPPQLQPHSSEHHCLTQIPWDYVEEARHTELETALGTMFPDPEVRQAALTLAGYALTPKQAAKVFFFLVGETDTGKTTFIEWLRALVGEEMYSMETIQDLTENRFSPAGMEGKLLNAPDELKNLTLKNVETLKAFTGGKDTYRVERKMVNAYQALITATLAFACNSLPSVKEDVGDAFYNRLRIIPFDAELEEDEKDPALRDEWPHDPDVMQAFLRLAADNLAELQQSNWRFSEPERCGRIKKDYRESNDPLVRFINQRVEMGPRKEVKRSDFYSAFEEFCEDQEVAAPPARQIYKRLRREFHIQEAKRRGEYWIKGLGLKILR